MQTIRVIQGIPKSRALSRASANSERRHSDLIQEGPIEQSAIRAQSIPTSALGPGPKALCLLGQSVEDVDAGDAQRHLLSESWGVGLNNY